MKFGSIFCISDFKCLIRDDTHIGKSSPHLDAQKDKAVKKASELFVGKIQASS
jgi:hypothetical protein